MKKQLILLGMSAQILFAIPSVTWINENEIFQGSVEYKEKLYFRVPVSANTSLKVKLTHLTADADLYIAQDRIPTLRHNDTYSSNNSNKDEMCAVTIPNNPSLKKTTVTILVYGFRTTDFTLETIGGKAQYPEKLTLNKGIQKHINFNASKDFKFSGKKSHIYTITLNKLSADADLRVKVGKRANKRTFDCKSTKSGTHADRCTIKLTNDATIYMNVFGFRDADYKITIKEQIKSNPITLSKLKEMIANGEDVTKVNTSKITDMSSLFKGNQDFNQSIGSWDVSNVTNMSSMFFNSKFNQDIGQWDVSNVTDMSDMFAEYSSFNQPINSWNVSNVTNMNGMFTQNYVFNQPIGSWDVSNVINMSWMFSNKGHNPFNQPIGSWDVSNVTNMGWMFFNCDFNQDVGQWDVSNVIDMDNMFYGYETKFKNHDLSQWNVSKVMNHERFSRDDADVIEPKWNN